MARRGQGVKLGDILAADVPEDIRIAEAADSFSRTEESGQACGNTDSIGVQRIRPLTACGAAEQLVLDGHDCLEIRRAGGWRSMHVMARYVGNVDIDADVVCRIYCPQAQSIILHHQSL
mgnify:CR=1 FL=1